MAREELSHLHYIGDRFNRYWLSSKIKIFDILW
ncbi:Uncharacterised protein [Actinobacillus suis]|nr:Uncharacterised protein [Actinobacillus suis]